MALAVIRFDVHELLLRTIWKNSYIEPQLQQKQSKLHIFGMLAHL